MKELIEDTITMGVLADFLTAEWGMDLAVFPDGTASIIEGNIRFRGDGPIARVPCPGIWNLDSSEFTEGFVRKNLTDEGDWDGQYITEEGRVIPTLADVIRECCRDGDVSAYLDELIARLIDDAENT